MAVADDLDTAAKEATRRMIVLLKERYALSRTDAYRHCSICGSLRVTQAVNVRKGVHMIVPRLRD
jgi:acetamidase/formamidase